MYELVIGLLVQSASYCTSSTTARTEFITRHPIKSTQTP